MNKYKLEDLCEIKSGGTPRRSRNEFFDGDILWAKIGDISSSDGVIYETEERITEEGLENINNRMFKKGTLLFSMYGSIGKVAIAGKDMSTNQAILGINIKDPSRLDQQYLNHWFTYKKKKLENETRGVTLKNLSATKVKNLDISLPPLETQKKIAAVLDKADTLRQKRRQTIEKLDALTRSVFLDMFGDPDKNPKGWEIGKFSDLAIIERNSVSPDEFAEHNYYLGLQDIEKDTGKILDRTEGAKVDLKSNKYSFNQNHILYGKLRPYLNKVASPDFSGFCSTDILPIKPIRNISNKSFLTYLMRHQSFVKYADTKSSGANLPRISPKLVKEYPAILPPIQKQEEFSLKANRINWLKEKNSFQFEEFNHLFNSLLQKAFKGELYFSGSEEPLLAAEEAAEYSA